MALGVLLILNSIIIFGVIIAQFFLYKEDANQKFFIINTLLGVLLSLLVFTSLPTNYTVQRVLSLLLGAFALSGFYLYTKKKNLFLAKGMLSIAIFGNLIQLFI